MSHNRIVAHRGYAGLYPENTMLAISKAREAGARFIEVDIQFTADHQPVVYHDLILNRISGQEGIITGLTLQQAEQLPAHEPGRFGNAYINERVLPLTVLVNWLEKEQEVTLFVEVKRTALAYAGVEKTFDILKTILQPVASRIVLISFDREFIDYASQQGVFKSGLVLVDWQDIHDPALTAMGLDYIFCDVEKIPTGADLSAIEPVLVVYEVPDWQQAAELFNRGVDMVETFNVGGLLEDLAHHAL